MLVVFPPIFVADTKMIYGYNFVAPFSTFIFFFGKKDPIKVPVLRLSSAVVKICQIPHFILQMASQLFFFKF